MRSAENFPFRGKFSEVYLHLNIYLKALNRKFRREEKNKILHWPKVTSLTSLSDNGMSFFFFKPRVLSYRLRDFFEKLYTLESAF